MKKKHAEIYFFHMQNKQQILGTLMNFFQLITGFHYWLRQNILLNWFILFVTNISTIFNDVN